MKIIIFFLLLTNLFAQELDGFLDLYYSTSNNNYLNNKHPYLTQPTYEDKLKLNLFSLTTNYDYSKFKTKLSLQIGDSVDTNYSSEKNDNFRYIQEATAGYQVNESTQIDAGIYLSHIGMESFISKDNFNLSRSLVAEFSPYYQSGVRVLHDYNSNLHFQLHLLNGWQNISEQKHPALGTQIKYNFTEKTSFIYNTFLGKENTNLRFFNDFIINHKLFDKLELAFQSDYGIDEESNSWTGNSLILKYDLNNDIKLATRLENYKDSDSIITSGLKAVSYSFNLDYKIIENLIWRNENRIIAIKKEKNEDIFISSLQYVF